jgi:hypothetical protein
MTKRIEAIAAKCRAENWEHADLDYVQFAKLIVKECISVVDNQFWMDGHEIGEAMELLKDHFGVQ